MVSADDNLSDYTWNGSILNIGSEYSELVGCVKCSLHDLLGLGGF